MTITARRLFTILVLFALLSLLSAVSGCKGGGDAKDEHMPAAGHPEEVADSTRLDAAEVDTFQESTDEVVESASPEDSTNPE